MQRRAAAAYFIIFSVLAVGALGFMQVGASQPQVDIDGPTYSQGDTLTVDGTTYTVTGISAESSEGEITRSGELTWFNDSAMESAQLENDSTVQFNDDQYRVFIANDTNVTSFSVTEERNISAIVANDSDAEELLTDEETGEQYVRFTNGSTQTLTEYAGLPDNETFAVGDTYPYALENETVDANVTAIEPGVATVQWDSPGNATVGLEEGANVTLNEQTYLVHFPDNSTVQILPVTEYYGDYQNDLSAMEEFDTRMNGLWGIVFLSLMAGIILIAAAYLPNKG